MELLGLTPRQRRKIIGKDVNISDAVTFMAGDREQAPLGCDLGVVREPAHRDADQQGHGLLGLGLLQKRDHDARQHGGDGQPEGAKAAPHKTQRQDHQQRAQPPAGGAGAGTGSHIIPRLPKEPGAHRC